ncbi:transcription factor GTE4 isoform X1 [Dendrobium catenatum]|uniref:transcription factor GTE4 isoform X1 n=1 Tax=Dendrobium catenatum TaxID=906689 RepID=UPI0009F6A55F|nr:transcription factor GTE4 isoform X1 [Dendrobium catenatum]XP_020694468.1 transcription factor GTE4 isoform X1 [Dendrobium catenatum]
MASGPLLNGGCDGSLEKRRWVESMVYTRKIHNKGTKTSTNQNPQPPVIQPPASSQTLVTTTDDVNSSLQQPHPTRQENHRSSAPHQSTTASDEDACSLNHKPSANHDISNGQNRLVTINLASLTKHEFRELRRKLNYELQLVRSLARKLEARKLQFFAYGAGKAASATGRSSANDVGASFPTKRALEVSETVSVAAPTQSLRPQLSVSVPAGAGGDNGFRDTMEKEKRTPKANQYYKNTDFLLGKDKFPSQEYHKKSKANGNKNGMQSVDRKFYEQAFKKCGVLLSKLMKHNHGWVFNNPVDADFLGLTDYHKIIKHPMDLGTVKSRLSKNWYKTPREFAEDVRLTFCNAMTYNPKGQDVHILAEQLLQIFEERWPVIEADLAYFHYPPSLNRPPPVDMRKTLERSDSTVHHTGVDLKKKMMNHLTDIGLPPASKKPKAKDPNKRDMTFDEKQRLSDNLQKLPSEKLDIVVQIIRKRNFSVSQHDDEIEVDIDSVDIETLWELDRFVTNYKKSLSKNKRKAALAILARAEYEQHAQDMDQRMMSDAALPESLKESKTGPVSKGIASSTGGAIVEIESRSSSSSSSSSDSGSTSSDSDSDSSSGFESDVAQ